MILVKYRPVLLGKKGYGPSTTNAERRLRVGSLLTSQRSRLGSFRVSTVVPSAELFWRLALERHCAISAIRPNRFPFAGDDGILGEYGVTCVIHLRCRPYMAVRGEFYERHSSSLSTSLHLDAAPLSEHVGATLIVDDESQPQTTLKLVKTFLVDVA